MTSSKTPEEQLNLTNVNVNTAKMIINFLSHECSILLPKELILLLLKFSKFPFEIYPKFNWCEKEYLKIVNEGKTMKPDTKGNCSGRLGTFTCFFTTQNTLNHHT